MHNGDTSMTVHTDNPAGDDNLFLAVVEVAAAASVTTEVCNNGVDDDFDGLIDLDDPTARRHIGLESLCTRGSGCGTATIKAPQFDVLTEFFDNGNEVAFGFQRCVKGLTRNPARRKK